MLWYCQDRQLYESVARVRALVGVVSDVLAESLPLRWDPEVTPPRRRLDVDGLDGLAADLHFCLTTPDTYFSAVCAAPFWAFGLEATACLGEQKRGEFAVAALAIEVGTSVLADPGGPRRLAAAFEAICEHLQPFYAEARVETGVGWDGNMGGRFRRFTPPLSPSHWGGLPRVAPLAMVIGAPYSQYWADTAGRVSGRLRFYGPADWASDQAGAVPLAPLEMLQAHDAKRDDGDEGEALPCFDGSDANYPSVSPPIWPFPRTGPLPLTDDAEAVVDVLDALVAAVTAALDEGLQELYPYAGRLYNVAGVLRRRIATERSAGSSHEQLSRFVDELDRASVNAEQFAAMLIGFSDQLRRYL
jgi:hypothetical protein